MCFSQLYPLVTCCSLVPQRVNRVQPGGLPRRIEAEDDADGAETDTAATIAASDGSVGQCRLSGQDRAAAARHDADHAAADAEQHRLGQELPEDVLGRAPTAMRRPISRVRSVTRPA